MTNTAIGDPEIMERRYPVILRQYSIREGSGGRGKFNGGHGSIREFEFLIDLQVSILSERRVLKPFGMEGGEDAKCGSNIWVKKIAGNKERRINMGGKSTAKFHAGDRIIISTPGGGGWGKPGTENDDKKENGRAADSHHIDTRKGSLASREQQALGS